MSDPILKAIPESEIPASSGGKWGQAIVDLYALPEGQGGAIELESSAQAKSVRIAILKAAKEMRKGVDVNVAGSMLYLKRVTRRYRPRKPKAATAT